MTQRQADYQALKDAGLCPGCKGDPPPGRVLCDACVARTVAYHRKHPEVIRAAMRRYRAAGYGTRAVGS